MRIILCVTNDVVTDCRIGRIAASLLKLPAEVAIIGLLLPNSPALPEYAYKTIRIRMMFRKGPLFYAEYNTRLFFKLLFCSADLLVANDLDTLAAVYAASFFKRLPVVYDSHEYFTELPELVNRPWVKKAWGMLESFLLPRMRYASTVSPSIASEYRRKYGVNMHLVRNLPYRMEHLPIPQISLRRHQEKIIMYQGSLNSGRGLETAIRAMQFTENSTLVVAGSGYLEGELRELVNSLALHEKVKFLGRVPPEVLREYTIQADLGISLEENLGLNYFYALPNKLFDYIQARVPVLISGLPEMTAIVKKYEVGMTTDIHDPAQLANVFSLMLEDNSQREFWKARLELAAAELCWENEEPVLLDLYKRVISGDCQAL
ncbi:MAG: glycosyltransferase [Bacteroidales bacterium]|nr:glycosyltransferase [Bacteroidales bacterium]